MTKDNEPDRRVLAGCGISVIITAALVVLGIVAAVIFVLFMFGSWLGGL